MRPELISGWRNLGIDSRPAPDDGEVFANHGRTAVDELTAVVLHGMDTGEELRNFVLSWRSPAPYAVHITQGVSAPGADRGLGPALPWQPDVQADPGQEDHGMSEYHTAVDVESTVAARSDRSASRVTAQTADHFLAPLGEEDFSMAALGAAPRGVFDMPEGPVVGLRTISRSITKEFWCLWCRKYKPREDRREIIRPGRMSAAVRRSICASCDDKRKK